MREDIDKLVEDCAGENNCPMWQYRMGGEIMIGDEMTEEQLAAEVDAMERIIAFCRMCGGRVGWTPRMQAWAPRMDKP